MHSELSSVAPVVLASAVRPPLNFLTALIGLGGLGLGAWLVWIGLVFDRPTTTSTRTPKRSGRSPEPRPEPDRTRAVV